MWHRHLSAAATSDHASGAPVVTAIQAGRDSSLAGQGATEGSGEGAALLDLGGTGDVFRASAVSEVTTTPAGGALQEGGTWPRFQGAIGGTLLALGDDPTIVSSPSLPSCVASPGPRGFGQWLECGEYGEIGGSFDFDSNGHVAGGGSAPKAAGAAPSLTITPETPHQAEEGSSIPVGARLLAPSGQPLEGALVHFTLQYTVDQTTCTPACTTWYSSWETQARTDPAGVALATLPLALEEFISTSGRDFRILATFDGQHGLYPRHAVGALLLS
jgi:hypothetical protein